MNQALPGTSQALAYLAPKTHPEGGYYMNCILNMRKLHLELK